MPATHAQETCTCVGQSGTSYFLVQVSCTQLSTALFQDRNCPARDTNRATWLAGELFWCKKLWWSCFKFIMHVSCAGFLSVCRWHKSIRGWWLFAAVNCVVCCLQLVQIAKILNTHVDSLQWIDHNTGQYYCPEHRSVLTITMDGIIDHNTGLYYWPGPRFTKNLTPDLWQCSTYAGLTPDWRRACELRAINKKSS